MLGFKKGFIGFREQLSTSQDQAQSCRMCPGTPTAWARRLLGKVLSG